MNKSKQGIIVLKKELKLTAIEARTLIGFLCGKPVRILTFDEVDQWIRDTKPKGRR